MPMIPSFFLVQSPFSMQFLLPEWPPPLSPGFFGPPPVRFARCRSRTSSIPRCPPFFAILARLAWIDWGKNATNWGFTIKIYQMWGNPVEFPPKKSASSETPMTIPETGAGSELPLVGMEFNSRRPQHSTNQSPGTAQWHEYVKM